MSVQAVSVLLQLLATTGDALLLAFVVFASRQGLKVTPDDRPDRSGQANYGDGGSDT
ncbi:hypothetical protein HL667_04850 [Bradyrhizobium sp. 83012]|uniref:Uncharacterized protein n=1 Tax=Bradyrhizobium aeschynomenes TaxID=2734909 RepID=A0ABX2C7U1_9BRAD|nr:hypothetical protein [Bradyrhizobium aeschynomenes]NPU14759.1 hypothetical protein [Bradyrhizobium aeschynomenes]NPU64319.1 hypothetical protein [Bradyrhizobium aeschynomenes]NPV21377.1 hypothetical protein [Bradyrhizobium aeschynomenes]